MASAATAVEANLFAFFHHLSSWPRVELHDEEEFLYTTSDLPFPLFNSVLRARLTPERAETAITERIEACRRRNVPMLWWTGPSSQPHDLRDRLVDRDFFIEPAHGMAMELARLPVAASREPETPAITIERVDSRSTLEIWTRVLCDAFGAPQAFGDAFADLAVSVGVDRSSPFRHYLARFQGEPAATCSLFLGAGVAGIYDVSTVPERRRRGIGRAITRAALRDAHAAGFRSAILHSSSLGVNMYRSIGFENVCAIGQFVLPADSRR